MLISLQLRKKIAIPNCSKFLLSMYVLRITKFFIHQLNLKNKEVLLVSLHNRKWISIIFTRILDKKLCFCLLFHLILFHVVTLKVYFRYFFIETYTSVNYSTLTEKTWGKNTRDFILNGSDSRSTFFMQHICENISLLYLFKNQSSFHALQIIPLLKM
jgi:hypothetical protein